ncbi:MAG: hypothetical protein BWX80_02364 [Candidatus Hydrogenedentes bacterium ADurb.Bin101]|nr:MAG: hypothetical protein BWX80_02364 [Candidatus Hydrogenedentes bacterium ADurb.Bin101]
MTVRPPSVGDNAQRPVPGIHLEAVGHVAGGNGASPNRDLSFRVADVHIRNQAAVAVVIICRHEQGVVCGLDKIAIAAERLRVRLIDLVRVGYIDTDRPGGAVRCVCRLCRNDSISFILVQRVIAAHRIENISDPPAVHQVAVKKKCSFQRDISGILHVQDIQFRTICNADDTCFHLNLMGITDEHIRAVSLKIEITWMPIGGCLGQYRLAVEVRYGKAAILV